jgi:hypothetical protein
MTKKIGFLLLFWLIYVFADYFYLTYFVQPFSWFLVCLALLVLSIRHAVKAINEQKDFKVDRIVSLLITFTLFLLTFYNFNKIPRSIIEKIDWTISFNKRNSTVNNVLAGKLKPNTQLNNGICKLPFDFPIISNGGNDILIYKNKLESTETIKFWISRGFFESPQIYFIFTNDKETKKRYNELIRAKPEYSWQLEDNWYRIMEQD